MTYGIPGIHAIPLFTDLIQIPHHSPSHLIGDLIQGKIDAITFTSPPAVNNLFMAADEVGQAEDPKK